MKFYVQTPLLVSRHRDLESSQGAEEIEKVYPVF